MKHTNTLTDTKDKLNYEYLKGKIKEETIELLVSAITIFTTTFGYIISYKVSFFLGKTTSIYNLLKIGHMVLS